MILIQRSQIFGLRTRQRWDKEYLAKNISFADEMKNGEGKEENIWRGKIFLLCSIRGPDGPKDNWPEQLCCESARVGCVREQVGCVCEQVGCVPPQRRSLSAAPV